VLRGIRAPPTTTAAVSYTVCPRRRGDRRFGPAVLLVRSPLGLLRRRESFGDGAVLRVYPDAVHFLRPEALDPRRVLAVIGVKPARRRGEGMDFESLRDYLPGDDPRRVDWRATARRSRLVVRQLQHERNHTVVIAIDFFSRLMASETDRRSKLDPPSIRRWHSPRSAHETPKSTVIFDRQVSTLALPPRRQLARAKLTRPVEPHWSADYEAMPRARYRGSARRSWY
jgi:hypothetical protein